MAIKRYSFDYNNGDASAEFEVDTETFTEEMAKETLNFFSWDDPYDKDADPIDEVLKKYATQAIWFATMNRHNVTGVISDFNEDAEGYYSVDGEHGIKLLSIDGIEIIESYLTMEVMQ